MFYVFNHMHFYVTVDRSVFLRVKFQGNTTSLMMFINLHSCQPISCDEHDNLFTNPPVRNCYMCDSWYVFIT